jgi:hypothetical protein
MVQANEIVNLGIILALLPLIYMSARRTPLPHRTVFTWAIGFMLLSWIVTILEGFFLPDLLNVLEHAVTATAGCLFAYGLFATLRGSDLYRRGSS